jgi:hypothetical protein
MAGREWLRVYNGDISAGPGLRIVEDFHLETVPCQNNVRSL